MRSSVRSERFVQPFKPLVVTFIKLTLGIAAIIVAFFLLAFVLKIVVFAAIVAAIAVGAIFLYNLFRRKNRLPSAR